MRYIIDRLKEPSTWLGVIPALLTLLVRFNGIEITEEQYEALKDFVVVVLAAGLVASKDSGGGNGGVSPG
jgi:hypothetical protein